MTWWPRQLLLLCKRAEPHHVFLPAFLAVLELLDSHYQAWCFVPTFLDYPVGSLAQVAQFFKALHRPHMGSKAATYISSMLYGDFVDPKKQWLQSGREV